LYNAADPAFADEGWHQSSMLAKVNVFAQSTPLLLPAMLNAQALQRILRTTTDMRSGMHTNVQSSAALIKEWAAKNH
jgi:hypothetical protein